jgi:cobalt-zinc-cadmium resistance protein CzcA
MRAWHLEQGASSRWPSFPEVTEVVEPDRPPRRWHRLDRILQYRIQRRSEAKGTVAACLSQNKDDLIAAMNQQLEKIPGVIWGFSQPIEDNMEEAVSGVKGELSVKIYGDDFKTLEEKGNQVVNVMSKIPGVADLGLFRIIGQPNLTFTVDRQAAARWGINVADVQDAIQTASAAMP